PQRQWCGPAAGGSFTLTATASDAQSGVTQVVFPDVSATSGWTGSTGGTDTTSPYAGPVNYAWTAGATAPGAKTVVATNGAGATNSDTITIAADSTAPSGQTVTLSGGPYYTTLSVPLTLGNGSDTESGVDATSGTVERDSDPQPTLAQLLHLRLDALLQPAGLQQRLLHRRRGDLRRAVRDPETQLPHRHRHDRRRR